jgi:hypothetical protein
MSRLNALEGGLAAGWDAIRRDRGGGGRSEVLVIPER